MKRISVLAILCMYSFPTYAINVFACEPEWGALVTEIAGDKAAVTVATTAFQDPHTLQARPSLIAAVRNADLVVCTGADLEIGWLPLLLRRAGNAEIQPGSQGYFMAADFVRKLEIPQVVDRAQGDVHPQGNPHVHLDARNMRRISSALGKRLGELEPSKLAIYQANLTNFQDRWRDAVDRWEADAAELAGLRLASNHRSFSYLANWLNLDVVATLEPKPGIPASGAQLANLLEQLEPNPPAAIIRTPYDNEKPSQWLADRIDSSEIVLPYTVGGADGVVDLFTLFDVSIAMLKEDRH
jgi:zinc/manganese transport system substrate-binding protein